MPTIDIDGRSYEVEAGSNLLSVCLSLGLDLPYFCWHPCMGSVGSCRQCAVIQYRDADDRQGRIIMSCMTPAADGARISIDAPEVEAFRAEVLELLMTNHPHDCPVCEEGGECHLQDMTVMTGHTFRQYRGKKRTHKNQYLGPFIHHEMNRCIACYRCVRFYRDYAGGDDLGVFASHNHVYFGRHEDGVLENEFSGNLVEVCPTGVFTDKTLSQHYTRKWDLQAAPSICVHCAVGCNISPGERYGALRRVINRYHGEINRYFLCDRGRFGYGFVNSDRRLGKPMIDQQPAVSWQAAQQRLSFLLAQQRGKVIGIGSPRASLEANFALRERLGADYFYAGFGVDEYPLITAIAEILRSGCARTPTLREVEQADAVLILGEDVANTAPMMALAVRQAARNASFDIADRLRIPRWQDEAVREAAQQERSPLFIATCDGTRLDDVAAATFRKAPDDLARLGFAVAHGIDPEAPAVSDLSERDRAQAEVIAAALKGAERPLIVSGAGCSNLAVIEAAANIARALPQKEKALSLVVPECNSIGLAMMQGRPLREALELASSGAVATVVVLENDLYRRAESAVIDRFLADVEHVVVIDYIGHETAERAELVLPSGTFAESEGTLVNYEGRAQRYFPVLTPGDDIHSAWQWLSDAPDRTDWHHVDEVISALAQRLPQFQSCRDAAPGAQFRIAGMKIPRQPPRYSGRTAMHANITVSEPKTPEDSDSALAFSMEGAESAIPPPLHPAFWRPGWNSNQSVIKFQDEINGHLRGGDPGVRLIRTTGRAAWFGDIPNAWRALSDQWLLTPIRLIFGSEPLSTLSAPLAERIPEPYVALNPDDASRLGVGEGDVVELEVLPRMGRQALVVRVSAGLPVGVAGIPVGLPGLSGTAFWKAAKLGTIS
jgi:NADH-quinone oxidoreductase subunit G